MDVVAWLLAKMAAVPVVITFYLISTGKLCSSRENNGNTRKVISWVYHKENDAAVKELRVSSVLPLSI